jgi:hypothetical protein
MDNSTFWEKNSPLILLTKYKVYATTIIPLKSSFKYKANGIIFKFYILYFLDQINGKVFSKYVIV